MEESRDQKIAEYKEQVMPFLFYLPWLEEHANRAVSTLYETDDIGVTTLAIPVFDGTLLRFVSEISQSPLIKRDYHYVYSRYQIKTHDDERAAIAKADWTEWDQLRGILSKYVLGGRTKAYLWNEAVSERIFFLVLNRMKEIIEFWDKPVAGQG